MLTGLLVVLLGIVIAAYPHILVLRLSSLFILFDVGIPQYSAHRQGVEELLRSNSSMATSWQFRRLRRHSESRFVNWIIRW